MSIRSFSAYRETAAAAPTPSLPTATTPSVNAAAVSPVLDDIPETFRLDLEGKPVKPDANKPMARRPFGRRV